MTRPQLHGTPLSHFTRKVRIVLAELGIEYDFVRTPGVLATSAESYGNNPLMRVPALVLGGATVIDSDHIARHLVGRYDPGDRLGIRSERVRDLNRLAALSGIMSNEVVLILARRGGGIADLDGVAYFRKLTKAMDSALAWLDADTDADAPFDYRDIALVCMWQHVMHYELVDDLETHTRLAARVARFAERPSVSSTAPAVSLAEAAAAGWEPG